MQIACKLTPMLLLSCTLGACVDQVPTSVLTPQAMHPKERQILDRLEALNYRGSVIIEERRAVDDQGEHPAVWALMLPENGMRMLRDARAAGNPHAAALRTVLATSEITDPEQIDTGYNTPTSQLTAGSGIRPSTVACGSHSVMTIRAHLYTANWETGQRVQIQEADILDTQVRLRANAGGHYHDGTTISTARMGTIGPKTGRMTGGTWVYTWDVPEFSQEFRLSILARHGNPEGPATEWFYSDDPFVSRYTGLVRMPPNDLIYDRVGGTTTHPEHLNDWGHPELIEKMQKAARVYHRNTGDRTRVNDMSLQYGGRFDIAGGWDGSHAEHRFAEVDTKPYNWTPAGRQRFAVALRAAGFTRFLVEKDHFHVRANASMFPCR